MVSELGLHALALSLSSALTPSQVVDTMLEHGRHALGASAGSVALLDRERGELEVVASRGYDESEVRPFRRFPLDARAPLADAAREGTAVLIERSVDLRARYPDVPGSGRYHAWCAVPLLVEGSPIGAVGFAYAEPHAFASEERAAIAAVAEHCALALERARLYDSLRRSEARYRALVEHSPEPIAVHADGKLVYVNPAAVRLVGASTAREVVGRSVLDFVHPDSRALVVQRVRDMVERGVVAPVTHERFLRLDGSPIDVEVAAMPIEYEGKRAVQVALRDITDRRRAEEELVTARRQVAVSERLSALGTLVAGVAHEIRTPLAYLSNNVFLIRSRLERAARDGATAASIMDELRPYSEAAEEGVERISRLVRELRRFTRSAENASTRRDLELRDVVMEAVHLYEATHPGRALVEVRLEGAPRVHGDTVQLQQVVINLLENAGDALPKGGRVRVAARETGVGETELTVEDEGPGIPEDVQQRMFDPFFTTKPDGTGLGLPIVRRIVEAHGGRVAWTTGDGKPTRFTVTLPALDGASAGDLTDPASQGSRR